MDRKFVAGYQEAVNELLDWTTYNQPINLTDLREKLKYMLTVSQGSPTGDKSHTSADFTDGE